MKNSKMRVYNSQLQKLMKMIQEEEKRGWTDTLNNLAQFQGRQFKKMSKEPLLIFIPAHKLISKQPMLQFKQTIQTEKHRKAGQRYRI